ncbi:MAG: lipopolysaccharide biosynthesis protein [Candidatus Aminicenantes bacterium]|nr:lipopolysaccharide biosynthesis protein [Candidatus Aminicenantes bacterium]
MNPSSNDQLSRQVAKGGFWVVLLRLTDVFSGLIRTVILARILSPFDFGLLGIALISVSLLETFSQTGFETALIQKKEAIENFLNSAWTSLIIRGVILFALLFWTAPYLSGFFHAPQAKPVLQVLSLTFLLQGFTNIGVVYFQKQLEFNKQFFFRISGTFADFIVVVSVALITRNVWALVFGILAGKFVQFVASYIFHPYRPRLQFDTAKIRELFNFGKWIFGSTVFIYFLTKGNDFFIGKFLGVAMLGLFQMADNVSSIPAKQITHVISQVTFPAYSKLQDEKTKLRETYLKVLKFTGFLSIPTAGLIFVFAQQITTLILGEKWSPMVPALKILAVGGLIRSLGATIGPVFHGIGKPEIMTKFMILQLGMFLALVYPFINKWELEGAALAAVVPGFLVNIILSFRIVKAVECSLRHFYGVLICPFAGTTVVVLSIMIAKKFLPPLSLGVFLILALSGIAVYLLINYAFNKELIKILKNLWRYIK